MKVVNNLKINKVILNKFSNPITIYKNSKYLLPKDSNIYDIILWQLEDMVMKKEQLFFERKK